MEAKQTVFVNEFTNGILDPHGNMLGPVQDGDTLSPILLLAAGDR